MSIATEALNSELSDALKYGQLKDISEEICSFFENCPLWTGKAIRGAAPGRIRGPALESNRLGRTGGIPRSVRGTPSESVAGKLSWILSIEIGSRETLRARGLEGSMANRS